MVTDTRGNLHATAVHAANIADCEGGRLTLDKIIAKYREGRLPRLACIMANHAYGMGTFAADAARLLTCRVEITTKDPNQHTFVPYPIRWIVEVGIAWLGRCRRLSKDYEYVNRCSESHILIASIQRLLNLVT